MNPDPAAADLITRIASINVDVSGGRIDVDEAVRTGKRRRWHRRLAVTGTFACVVAATTSAVVVMAVRHDDGGAPFSDSNRDVSVSPAEVFGPASMPDRITGRWLAVTLDGRDISSWRDVGGQQATILIGADDQAGQWQVNRTCGPLTVGSFVLQTDDSFTATIPPPRFQSCPMVTTVTPDLVDAISRTAHVTVSESNGSTPRTLRFLDSARHLIISWREDVLVSSRSILCRKVLGHSASTDGTFTTVDHLRLQHGPRTGGDDLLPQSSGGTVAVYCKTVEARIPVRYAVTEEGERVRLRD